jgi:Ca-activated chloride channel homolog
VLKRVECIEGTGVDSAPQLHGYVTTKPKPLSETILVSDKAEPILARWKVGLGNSVAWTSDVKNRWAVEWLRWGGYSRFMGQMVRCTMRKKSYDSYDLFAKVEDGRAQITVDAVDVDDRFVNELDTTLEIIDPASSKVAKRIPMVQSAAGRYQADFQVDRYGSYLLKAVHKRGDQVVAESTGAVALSYPEEYLKTSPDEEPLRHAALVSGGKNKPTPDQIWDPEGQHKTYTEDLWPWILLVVACLIVLDIYFKRVRVFGYRTIKFQ